MTRHLKWPIKAQQSKLLPVIGVIFLSLSFNVMAEVCSFGGSDDIDALSSAQVAIGQYLDLTQTAPCNGSVKSIRYCSFESTIGNFSVRIWRPSGDNYTMLKEYSIRTAMSESIESTSNVACKQVAMNGNQSIQVLIGDIIGLYIESATLGLITSSVNNSTSGLYYDTRTSSEIRDSTIVYSEDLSFNSSLQHHLQIEIGYEISVLEPTVTPHSSGVHVNTVHPGTSKLIPVTHITSTSTQFLSEEFAITGSTITPMSTSFATNTFRTSSPVGVTSSSLVGVASSYQVGVASPSSMGVATTSTTSILMSRSSLSSSIVPPTSTLHSSTNSQTMILIAGVSAGCVVIVILVAIVIVVSSIVSRSHRTVFVHSSKKSRAPPKNNGLFDETNNNAIAENGISETVLINELRLHDNITPVSHDSSQGNQSEDDGYSRLKELQSIDKHTSVHIYNTIETLRREQFNRLPLPMERSQSEMRDYEVPISALSNYTMSLENVQASTRTTMTFMPSDYEIPGTAMSGYCSEEGALSDCSSTSYVSIPEEPFAIDSDIELWRKCKQRLDSEAGKRKRSVRKPGRVESMDGPYSPPPSEMTDLHKRLKDLCIEFISLKDIQPELGMIQPSLISQRAVLKRRSGHDRPVILRSTDPVETDRDAMILLLQEAIIMAQIRHPNVVQLHGLVMEDKKLMLVLEQFPKEDLRRYLVQMGRSVVLPDAAKVLLKFSQQVALGMHYLASKGFVHRDLAARNVFVTKNDVCKVGELAKCLEYSDPEEYIMQGGKLPIRWMSPEAMYKKRYSTASDVWAYGCLLYEVWSLGRMPFREYTNAEVIEKIDSGYRLPPPPGCPRAIYDLMIQCWHPYPLSRPTFKDILNTLLSDESQILLIPTKDAATHEAAIVLGAKLEAGKYLYQDLQTTYTERPQVRVLPAGLHDSQPIRSRSPQVSRRPPGNSDYDHIAHSKVTFTAFPTSSADIDHMYKPKGMSKCKIRGDECRSSTSTEDDFDVSAFSFRQRLSTDDKSDYADIS